MAAFVTTFKLAYKSSPFTRQSVRTLRIASKPCTRQRLLQPTQRTLCIQAARSLGPVMQSDIKCELDVLHQDASVAAETLSVACRNLQKGAGIHLKIEGLTDVHEGKSEYDQAASCAQWLNAFVASATKQPAQPLQRVTSVSLNCYILGDLVPQPLVSSCCNMRQLYRHGWLHMPLGSELTPSPCPQLQHLSLESLTAPGTGNNMSEQQMQQQFRSLPNLKSLDCSVESDRGRKALQWLEHSLAPLHAQLEALALTADVGKGSRGATWHTSALLTEPWPQLKRLKLMASPPTVISDNELEMLLQKAPATEELETGAFMLKNSFAHQRSGWKQLTLQYINGHELAQLPLLELQTLHYQQVLLQEADWAYLPVAAKALEGVADVKAANPSHGGLWLEAFPSLDTHQETAAALIKLAEKLQVSHVEVHVGDESTVVGSQWLQLIAQLPCNTLTIDPFTLPVDCWPTLLKKLPQVKELQLCVQQHFEEQPNTIRLSMLVTALCVSAQRPVTLRLGLGGQGMGTDGWQQLLQDLMRGAGHQHVALEPLEPAHMLMVRMPFHEGIHHVSMFA